jgi:hypothetical protein
MAEKMLGPNHLYLARIFGNLGVVYFNQGKYVQARQFYEQSMQIVEIALGSDNPQFAQALTIWLPVTSNWDRMQLPSRFASVPSLF